MKNATWTLGLAILAAALSACGGGSGTASDSGSSGAAASASSSAINSSTSGGSASSASSSAISSSTSGGSASSASSSSSVSSIPGSTTNLTTPMGQTAAARLLMQGTFGATQDTIASTAAESYSQWFAAQAAATPSLTLPSIAGSNTTDWTPAWYANVVQGSDQLRQRMAFALSEILVTSGNGGPIWDHNLALADYYDTLVQDALGNFRQLLQDVTLSPGMGEFLSMMRNDKPNAALNTHADQNYAREVMQLFTVGLVELNIDGSVVTDSSGNPVPTYSQDDIIGLSNVFTGWSSAPTTHTGDAAWQYDLNETTPMVAYEDHHDTDAKTIIGGVQVPAGGTAEADLKIALDTLFNHPNVGPFISKQLIQRLVTSNPSPQYVQRVAQVFNNDGTGTRGNLLAVAEAILTDPEAVTPGTSSTAGKLREPLLRLTSLWRAFNAYNSSNNLDDANLLLYAYQWFAEDPLYSPTVFNFFQPSYQVAGALTTAGMVAPEFEITNEATLVTTDNAVQLEAYQYIDSAGNKYAGPDYSLVSQVGSSAVFLHTAEWEPLAANPASLVNELNLVLMAGQLSPASIQVLVNYASALPATPAATRVVETAELLLSSPEYVIQR